MVKESISKALLTWRTGSGQFFRHRFSGLLLSQSRQTITNFAMCLRLTLIAYFSWDVRPSNTTHGRAAACEELQLFAEGDPYRVPRYYGALCLDKHYQFSGALTSWWRKSAKGQILSQFQEHPSWQRTLLHGQCCTVSLDLSHCF
jgi:hypothetical protein